MADSFSPNRGYVEQQVGNNVGSWGTLLNAEMIAIMDNNMGGNLTKDVSGAVDITLSSTEAENLYYNLTGTLTGNINVIWAAGAGFYIVTNNTMGAFTLTVRPTGGTGITINQGTSPLVFISTNTGTAFIVQSAQINAGTTGELAYYAASGEALSGTTALPNGTTATTQTAADNSTKVATTAYADANGSIAAGTTGELAFYATDGQALSGTGALPNGTTATTQAAADSTTKVATTGFVNGTALTLAAGSTAVTQAFNDNSTKVATTAFVNPLNSRAETGYVLLPCALYLQWGKTTGSGTTHAVTFPIAFPNAFFSAQATYNDSGHTATTIGINNTSVSGMTINTPGIAGSSSTFWWAVGN